MMKYKLISIFVFSFFSFNVEAQQLSIDVNSTLNADFGKISIYDPAKYGGKSLSTVGYADVEGSPFRDDHWLKAIVYAKSGKAYKFEQTKLNMYTGELHYLTSSGQELALEPGLIEKMVFIDRKDSTKAEDFFVSLPDFVDRKPAAFYRVFNNGIYQLISLQKSLVKTNPYDPLGGKKSSSFYAKTYYAIYNNGRIIPLKSLDYSNVKDAVNISGSGEIWLKQNRNKLHTENDLVEFLQYLNASEKQQ